MNDDITILEAARIADISKATLYNYQKNKIVQFPKSIKTVMIDGSKFTLYSRKEVMECLPRIDKFKELKRLKKIQNKSAPPTRIKGKQTPQEEIETSRFNHAMKLWR